MVIRFLADESLDFRIVRQLRTDGFDITSILEDFPGISDSDVLRIAVQQRRILITEDKDFGELAFRMQKLSAGIILVRLNGLSGSQKLLRISEIFERHYSEMAGHFLVVANEKVRVKVL